MLLLIAAAAGVEWVELQQVKSEREEVKAQEERQQQSPAEKQAEARERMAALPWRQRAPGGAIDGLRARQLVFLEAVFFPFIEEVCLGAAQVDDLWTAVSLQTRRGAGQGRRAGGRQQRAVAALDQTQTPGGHNSEKGGELQFGERHTSEHNRQPSTPQAKQVHRRNQAGPLTSFSCSVHSLQ